MGQNISNLTRPLIVIQGTKETCVVLGIEYPAADLVVTQSTTGYTTWPRSPNITSTSELDLTISFAINIDLFGCRSFTLQIPPPSFVSQTYVLYHLRIS
jgi:hypothetical protein